MGSVVVILDMALSTRRSPKADEQLTRRIVSRRLQLIRDRGCHHRLLWNTDLAEKIKPPHPPFGHIGNLRAARALEAERCRSSRVHQDVPHRVAALLQMLVMPTPRHRYHVPAIFLK